MSSQSRKVAIEAESKEYEAHLADSMRRSATHMESLINLIENARYIDAWRKAQGIRDSIVYNMDVLEQRVKRMSDENNTK